MTSPALDRVTARLVEKAFTERDILSQAIDAPKQQVHRDGTPNGWYPGDPETCADCAVAIAQARDYCLDEAHACDPFCWDDVRCPSCREVAP